MVKVIFFEKPGCINNTRQKKLLRAAGHEVDARSLLEEPWTAENLRKYFGNLPVSEWFNRTAPAVKSGDISPDTVSEQQALSLMIDMPLLIRRPLMQVDDEYRMGFDMESVHQWIGLAADAFEDVETCPKTDGAD